MIYMALSPSVYIIIVIIINSVLFYIAAAIMCSIMFRREIKKWSWLNLIMAVVAALAWVFGVNFNFIGSAGAITFGIIIFLICWIIWVLGGGISERRAMYATFGTMIIWFALSWILLVILYAFQVTLFSPSDFPTLIGWLP